VPSSIRRRGNDRETTRTSDSGFALLLGASSALAPNDGMNDYQRKLEDKLNALLETRGEIPHKFFRPNSAIKAFCGKSPGLAKELGR
jgi:hypothetical protein